MENVSFEMQHCANSICNTSEYSKSDASQTAPTTTQSVVIESLPLDHHNPQQAQRNDFGVTINNRTLINVIMPSNVGNTTTAVTVAKQTSAIAMATLETAVGAKEKCTAAAVSKPPTASSSIEEHWYSLPLRWRTHPSATVDRRPRKSTKKKSLRHSWHVSEPIVSATSILDGTINNADSSSVGDNGVDDANDDDVA